MSYQLSDFKKLSPWLFELPASYRTGMQVPARIYSSEEMLTRSFDERSIDQLVNVAMLPGIEWYALAMPDIHQGYGFPIGGVAAFRSTDGIISPGGVGYDINCGVRLLGSQFNRKDFSQEKIVALANQIERDVPSGVGRGGHLKLSQRELNEVLRSGCRWALEQGFATQDDLEKTEENGSHPDADANLVSEKAKNRGRDQLGTIGAGNHFLEVQEVIDIYDEEVAQTLGLFQGQVTVMIHTGSRGLGHQNCTDYVRLMNPAVQRQYGIEISDRELACAPFHSREGQAYYRAMAAAANFAWVNRQYIAHLVRGSWQRVFGSDPRAELRQIYDVAHNMAKKEVHNSVEYIVHRKGATRAFGPGRSEIPQAYRAAGQPVLIPGSMGTVSYVLTGTKRAMQETFGSCCHGAGRQMSRMRAKKSLDYDTIKKSLEDYGVVFRAGSREVLEEAPQAYKDVEKVVEVVVQSGIAKPVVRMRPLAVIKG